MKTIEELKNTFHGAGKVDWISVRPVPKGGVVSLNGVEATTSNGLVGDHYNGTSGNRQVTFIQKEHIQAVATILGRDEIDPKLLRRNIVVSGINLLAFESKKFRVGNVILEMTSICEPCSRMEDNLGDGGYNAMVGHGGICARVLKDGKIELGDEVVPIQD